MLTLEGIEDRTQAESLLPFELKVSRDSLPSLAEDEVYLADLEGKDIFDHGSGELLGQLKGFYDHPGQSVAIIKTKDKELLEIPFVKTFFPIIEERSEGYRIEAVRPELV